MTNQKIIPGRSANVTTPDALRTAYADYQRELTGEVRARVGGI
ncbi:hypothetical protein WJ438_04180 [Streptomyces sp. GD-15H]